MHLIIKYFLFVGLFFCPLLQAEETSPAVGFIVPLSGPLAQWGQAIRNGAQLAQNNNNSLRLLFEDDGFSAQKAITAFRKLLAADSPTAFVVFGGQSVEALRPLAEKAERVLISITANGDYSKSPWVMRYYVSTAGQVNVIADFVKGRQFSRVAIIVSQQEAMQDNRRALSERLAKMGVQVTNVFEVLPTDTDFRAIAARLKQTSPDAIMFATHPPHTSLAMKQIKNMGINIPSIGFIPTEVEDEVISSNGAMNDMYYSTAWVEPSFRANYTENFAGAYPYPVAASGYSAVKLFQQALAHSAMDSPHKLRQYITNTSGFKAAFGHVTLKASNEFNVVHRMMRIEAGKFVEYNQ